MENHQVEGNCSCNCIFAAVIDNLTAAFGFLAAINGFSVAVTGVIASVLSLALLQSYHGLMNVSFRHLFGLIKALTRPYYGVHASRRGETRLSFFGKGSSPLDQRNKYF